jgi:hypothetical protein
MMTTSTFRTEVNDLAIRYAKLPDGPDKEAAFLKLVECFHGYLIKYTNMVIRGQLPNPTSRVGKDAAEMLKKLLPRGSNPDQTVPVEDLSHPASGLQDHDHG